MDKRKMTRDSAPADDIDGLLADFTDEFEARADEIRLKRDKLDFSREWHYDGIHYKKFTRRNHVYLCAFGIFYAFFLILGALSFMSIESPTELEARRQLILYRNTFATKYNIQG